MKNTESYISHKIIPPGPFEVVFSHFYAAENRSASAISKILLPSFQTILLFNFGTSVTFRSRQNSVIDAGKVLVLGPVKQPIDYTMWAGADILVANFKPGAFYGFFGQALIAAESAHPDNLIGDNCFTGLWQSLKVLSSAAERVQFILEFCQPYLKQPDGTLSKMTSTEQNPVFNPVKSIAQESDLSERSIQLKHKKFLGYSAKESGRYQRFLKAIALLEDNIISGRSTDWFDLIGQCGYYDQSQLIHDFNHYLGLSPTKYLKFQEDICIARLE